MFIGQQLPRYFFAPAERNVIGKSISLLRSEESIKMERSINISLLRSENSTLLVFVYYSLSVSLETRRKSCCALSNRNRQTGMSVLPTSNTPRSIRILKASQEGGSGVILHTIRDEPALPRVFFYGRLSSLGSSFELCSRQN